MSGPVFRGAGTALVTPFTAAGGLDEAALRRLVRRQLDAGIDFLVPCGTTGETPTRARCRCWSTTLRVAPAATLTRRRCSAWPGIRTSWP